MERTEMAGGRWTWGALALLALLAPALATITSDAMARDLDDEKEVRAVFVLERQRDDLDELALAVSDPRGASYGRYWTVEQVAARYGASDATFARVAQFLAGHGASAELDVTRTFASAVLHKDQIDAIFGKDSSLVPPVPAELRDVVSFVIRGHFHSSSTSALREPHRGRPGRGLAGSGVEAWPPWNMTSGTRAPCPDGHPDGCTNTFANPGPKQAFHTFTPDQLRTAYGVEATGLTGRGRTAAVVEFGQRVHPPDIREYARGFGRAELPLLQVMVDGSEEEIKPGFEATLDVETFAGVATGLERLTLLASRGDTSNDYRLYGLVLYSMALDRNVTGGRLIDVLSTSWLMSCEPDLHETGLVDALENIFQTAAAAGVTVAAAAGDQGSSACTSREHPYDDRRIAVEYPSSSPWVTAVGGTSLMLDRDNRIADVRAWNDWPLQLDRPLKDDHCHTPPCRPQPVWAGSGGRSTFFDRPPWQTGPGVEADGPRQLPDLAFLGDMYPGTAMYRGGWHHDTGNGTSQATPIFGAITLLLNEAAATHGRPRVGFANPLLYDLARRAPQVFYDVVDGDNVIGDNERRFDVDCCYAGPGFDMTSGWGSLHVARALDVLSGRRIAIRPGGRLPVVR